MHRRDVLAGLSLAGAALAVPALAQSMSPRELLEAFARSLSAHDLDGFGKLFADGYINHQVSAAAPPPSGTTSAKQGTIAFFGGRLKGIPDLKVSIETMVATEDMGAASFLYEGTQTGPLMGVPATGKHLRFTSCDIFRVADGLIAEHWGMGDIAGQLAQMKG